MFFPKKLTLENISVILCNSASGELSTCSQTGELQNTPEGPTPFPSPVQVPRLPPKYFYFNPLFSAPLPTTQGLPLSALASLLPSPSPSFSPSPTSSPYCCSHQASPQLKADNMQQARHQRLLLHISNIDILQYLYLSTLWSNIWPYLSTLAILWNNMQPARHQRLLLHILLFCKIYIDQYLAIFSPL